MKALEKEIFIRLLAPSDDRSSFESGNIELDRFFRSFAGQNQFRHYIGTTYVAVTDSVIAGYVTVSMGELTAETLSRTIRKRLPAYPLPILRIARLAVDRRFRKQGIGSLLLKSMLDLALQLREKVGCAGVVVDAKEQAVSYYARYGFIPIDLEGGGLGERPEPTAMFLPIRLIAKAAKGHHD